MKGRGVDKEDMANLTTGDLCILATLERLKNLKDILFFNCSGDLNFLNKEFLRESEKQGTKR